MFPPWLAAIDWRSHLSSKVSHDRQQQVSQPERRKEWLDQSPLQNIDIRLRNTYEENCSAVQQS